MRELKRHDQQNNINTSPVLVRKKVLFLNPPGKQIYIRDYYCSKVSKAYYLPQPVDLLTQTSFFSYENYDLKVIDAIAEKWSKEKTISELIRFKPDYIIGQFGSASLNEDVSFYEKTKNQIDCKILCSGDVLLEDSENLIKEYEWLDAIITDFYKPGPLKYIEGQISKIDGLVFKKGLDVVDSASEKYQKSVALSIPKHELFNNKKYRMPFATGYPMATVLTNYACPYPCTFCIMSHLEFKTKKASAIIEELLSLKDMGIKFIYFSDQTFYTIPKIMDEVLDYMIEHKLNFKWMCFSRVDIMTEDRLTKMKNSGCQVIMYGVEWAEEKYLKKYKKQYSVDQIKTAFSLTKKVGIKRLGTFLMGVPGQTRESIENTLSLAIEIDADYASFNVAVPRANTSFREEAIEQGLIDKDEKIMDQSGSFFSMGTGKVSAIELAVLKKRAYRKFYLRPGYLVKRVIALKNWQELKSHVLEGWYVLKSHILN